MQRNTIRQTRRTALLSGAALALTRQLPALAEATIVATAAGDVSAVRMTHNARISCLAESAGGANEPQKTHRIASGIAAVRTTALSMKSRESNIDWNITDAESL